MIHFIFAERHYAECCNAAHHYTECYYAGCRYTGCLGVINFPAEFEVEINVNFSSLK
jgi:hypothetical protein